MYGLRCRMQSCSSKGIFCFLFKPKCRVLKMDSFWATDLPNMTTMNRSVLSSLDFLIGKSLSINRKSCQSPGFCPEIFVYIITPICNKKQPFKMKEQFPSERKCPPCLPLQVTFTSSHQKYTGGATQHLQRSQGKQESFSSSEEKPPKGQLWSLLARNVRSRVNRRSRTAQLTVKTNCRLSSINVAPHLCLDWQHPTRREQGRNVP